MQPVMPILAAIEAQRNRHGNEQLSWLDFVRILVFYFTVRPDSMRSLVVALENADEALALPAVKRSTLSDSFSRFSPALLRQAMQQALETLPLAQVPELALLGDVHLVDGSEFPVVGGFRWPLPGDPVAKIKLHLEFALNRMTAVDFVIGEAKSSERVALREMLQAHVLYVLDRGYPSFALFRDMMAAKADFVTRVYESMNFVTVTEFPAVLPTRMQGVWSQVSDCLVRSDHPDAEGMTLRLVTCTVGDTTYRLLSNRLDLTTFQIILVYALRWQVELIFRHYKHALQGQDVITISPVGMANYFAAMFLTALLHLCLKQDSLAQAGHLPSDEIEAASAASTSSDPKRPTVHLAVACFFKGLNEHLALFWKISKHWLRTLADYLSRPFGPDVVAALNKHAFYGARLK